MNDERQALLDALAAPRLPPVSLGWVFWLLLAILILGIGIAILLLRRRRAHRLQDWKPEADAALASLRQRLQGNSLAPRAARDWLADASALSRRIVLVKLPRSEIAPLTGDAWQHRLRQFGALETLDDDDLQLLGEASYRRDVSVGPESLQRIADGLAALVDAAGERGPRSDASGRAWRA